MERYVYILITKSSTYFSRLIHIATAAPYTHASIGLDGPQGYFYSFARKYTRLCLPAGLVREAICAGSPGNLPYRMYRLRVSEGTYRRIRDRLESMYHQRSRYSYNLLGAFSSYFNYPLKRRSSYFCSQFVAELLECCGALEFDKNIALVQPVDFCRMEQLSLVSEGVTGGLSSGRALPAPSEVAAILPFGRAMVRVYRSHSRVR